MKKFVVIDAHSYIYRAFYGFINNPLRNSLGENTSAIYGFTKYILNILEKEKPEYIAVAYDVGKKTFRNEIKKDYKAGRPPMPDELKGQIQPIFDIVKAMGINLLGIQNYEADDLIATLVKKFSSKDHEFLIYTSDKDAYQLVTDTVRIYSPDKGGQFKLIDEKAVTLKTGVKPEDIIDYMALTGDKVDNVLGIPGVGPKTAAPLINQYKNLDTLYENIEQIPKKGLKKKLEENRESAFTSRVLVTMKNDIPLPDDYEQLESYTIDEWDKSILTKILKKYELFSILRQMGMGKEKSEEKKKEYLKKRNLLAETDQKIENLINTIKSEKIYSLRIEYTGQSAAEMIPAGFAVSTTDTNYFIPLTTDLFNPVPEIPDSLIPVFTDENIEVILFNHKIYFSILKKLGIGLKNRITDIMLLDFILDANNTNQDIFKTARRLLGLKLMDYKEFLGTASKKVPISDKGPEEIMNFSSPLAEILFPLKELLEKEIKKRGSEPKSYFSGDKKKITELYNNVFLPLSGILGSMELRGIKINKKLFSEMSVELEEYVQTLSVNIYKEAGKEFNINSPKQLREILFTDLGLKGIKKTKTGYSTNNEVLQKLKYEHPIVPYLLDYRKYTKLLSTYLNALPDFIAPETGRIHTTLHGTGTATGRLSSNNPNLQNIPVRDIWGKRIRSGFIAEDGFSFIRADYSQIELRVLAAVAGVKELKESFSKGLDIHARTAAAMYGKSVDSVTDDERSRGKVINFSIVYGKTVYGLANDLDISFSDAKEFLDNYFDLYPEVEDFMNMVTRDLKEKNTIPIISGLTRPFLNYNSVNGLLKKNFERAAINTPIQGIASHIMKLAMINVSKGLEK
ncbi:MAG: DNA polymerase I, partial [Actinomycetia bacterium]|nr:DNA polymerase I [Actinomycetes bacterium]